MSYHSYNNKSPYKGNQYDYQDYYDPYDHCNQSNHYQYSKHQYYHQYSQQQNYQQYQQQQHYQQYPQQRDYQNYQPYQNYPDQKISQNNQNYLDHQNFYNYQNYQSYQYYQNNPQQYNQYSGQYQNYQPQNTYNQGQDNYYSDQNQNNTKQQNNYNQQNYSNEIIPKKSYHQPGEQQPPLKETKKVKYVEKPTQKQKTQQKVESSSNISNVSKTEPNKPQLSSNPLNTNPNSGQQSQEFRYEPGKSVDVKWYSIPKKVGRMNWRNPFKECNVKITESMFRQYETSNNYFKQQRQYQKNYQSRNIGNQRQINTSYTQCNNLSFEDSFNLSSLDSSFGKQEIGRYGGDKKNKKRINYVPKNSNDKQKNPHPTPKQKIPSLIQEANNQGYFAGQTEEIQYQVCPFNPSHIMSKDRLYTHIHRCKEKAPNARQYVNCPYDACHYFLESDIEAHKLVCDKRHLYLVDDSWDTVTGNLQESTLDPEQKSMTIVSREEKKPLNSQDPEKQAYDDWLLQDF